MIRRVLGYVEEHHMLEAGDCVVAGVSGGADSVCLLLMLLEIRKSLPVEIRVVHVNHLIREEAAEEAGYVRALCGEHGLAFTLVEEDVQSLARSRHISTEEAGREVRYRAFYRELGSRKGKIAIAHNRNDCCETFLFHLFRGTSLKGLTGIRPVRDEVVRPLMCLDRREIESFLRERNIRYCIDSTNLEDHYTRNRIRRHILETAVREVCPAAAAHISSACERMGEAYDLIADITAQGYAACVTKTQEGGRDRYHIDREKFLRLHRTIQGYVLMEALLRAAGSRRDLGAVHIRQTRELMDKQCGREISLPYRLRARRDYTGVCIYGEGEAASRNEARKEAAWSVGELENLMQGGSAEISINGRQRLRADIFFKKDINLQNIPQKKYTKWLDYDKIKSGIAVRTRRQGDYLTVNEAGQRKTLKAYFIDRKIPQEQRGSICLVADGSHIIWAIGERISSSYKVSGHTERILRLSFIDDDTGTDE